MFKIFIVIFIEIKMLENLEVMQNLNKTKSLVIYMFSNNVFVKHEKL